MRLGGDVLAKAEGLAGGWRLGSPASRTAAATAEFGSHRLDPGLHEQFVHRSEKGGAAAGSRPHRRHGTKWFGAGRLWRPKSRPACSKMCSPLRFHLPPTRSAPRCLTALLRRGLIVAVTK